MLFRNKRMLGGKIMKRLLALIMVVLLAVSVGPLNALADEVSGTRQKITIEELDGGTFYAYHATENGVLLTLYCFNSDLAWPVTDDRYKSEYFVPDTMLHLSDDVKDKVYRILYAGYPYDNVGICSPEESPVTMDDLKDACTPPQAIRDLMPYYDWNSLDFSPENLIGVTDETDVIVDILMNSYDDDFLEALGTKPAFEFLVNLFMPLFFYDEPFTSVDQLLSEFSEAVFPTTPGGIHDATQIAIWRILYENNVPNNPKDMSQYSADYTLARALVDFANGVGPYADAKIPDRGTTLEDMEKVKESFEDGAYLLRADNSPVGDGKIVFTRNAEGAYVSEPLHFSDQAFTVPYEITLKDGSTVIASATKNGTDAFVLKTDKEPANGVITVAATDTFPSDVYQYVIEAQQNMQPSELSHDGGHVQDMSGVYYQKVSALLSLGTEFVSGGELKVTKSVTGNVPETDKDKAFAFTVTLSDTTVNGTYGDMTFKDGVATFELKKDESKEAANLPVGVGYEVEEESYVGYKATATNEKGTIPKEDTASVSFVNAYDADSAKTEVTFSGRKTLKGRALQADEFRFTLTSEDDGTTETVTNAADGRIKFKTITFTKEGTFNYTVKEEATDEAGVTIDEKVYRISVTVAVNDKGKLAATISGDTETGTDLDFTNTYMADVPKTGDDNHILVWAGLLLMSSFALLKTVSADEDRRRQAR